MAYIDPIYWNISGINFSNYGGINFIPVPEGSIVFYPPSSFMIYQTAIAIIILAVGIVFGYYLRKKREKK